MSAEATASTHGRRELVRRLAASPHRLGLAGVLGLAAFLDFFRLDQNGYANAYYSATVRSMLASWQNFFFVSFDPGGLVSVDKPPLALWAEAVSAKVFGYSGFAMLLPQALAGVASVWLLYLLVARVFGRAAGLVAALALAVSPVSVAVNRDNNPDALFTLLLVAAAYLAVRALESGSLRWLLATAATVGLAFNTKTFEALIVVPALALAYVLCAPGRRRTRLAHLALAGLTLVAVSGAWLAAVDLTPAGKRPYVASTADNSALSLALDYNGLDRVTGRESGVAVGGRMLGTAFSGDPGPLRLINDALGDQGGWILPLAVAGGASALLAAARARRRRDLGALLVLGGWFVAAAAVFSFSTGIIHTYYLSALAPATGGLVGAGAVALWRDARRGGVRLALPLAALALTAWVEVDLLRRAGYLPWLRPVVIGLVAAAGVALVALAVPRLRSSRARPALAAGALGLAVAALLAPPAAWAQTTFAAPVSGVFPGAGPHFVPGLGVGDPNPLGFVGNTGFLPPAGAFGPPGGGFPGSPEAGRVVDVDAALAYAKAHDPGSRWTLILPSAQEASPYVIRGEAVAAMGGFTGGDTILPDTRLAELVASGSARHFLVGGRLAGPLGGSNPAVARIAAACVQVPVTAWSGLAESSGFFSGASLYDCAGKAEAIARAGE